MEKSIIQYCKSLVDDNNLPLLQCYYNQLTNDTIFDVQPNWDYIFQRVYLHACLRKRRDVAEWMKVEIYPTLNDIQRTSIRHVFAYGKHLMNK